MKERRFLLSGLVASYGVVDLAFEAYFAMAHGDLQRCDILIEAAMKKRRRLQHGEEHVDENDCAAYWIEPHSQCPPIAFYARIENGRLPQEP